MPLSPTSTPLAAVRRLWLLSDASSCCSTHVYNVSVAAARRVEEHCVATPRALTILLLVADLDSVIRASNTVGLKWTVRRDFNPIRYR
jgi:hypothetical protein